MPHPAQPSRSSARRRARSAGPALLAVAGIVALSPSAAHAASNIWLTPPGPGVGTPSVGTNFLSSSASLSGDGERAVIRYFQSAPFVLAEPAVLNPVQLLLIEPGSTAGPRIISRASGAGGELGNGASGGSSAGAQAMEFDLADGGGSVAFVSLSTNLVTGDTNAGPDVFVRDLDGAQATERVSVDSAEAQAASTSAGGVAPTISDDGRYVAFSSGGVANWQTENVTFPSTGWGANTLATFVRDRQAGTTTTVSAKDGTDDVVAAIGEARISGDGRFVAFRSRVADVAGPGVPAAQTSVSAAPLYLRELATKRTTLISQDLDGNPVAAFQPQISADGRYVLFSSAATNLVTLPEGVAQPANMQVYLRDTVAQTTTLVSASLTGEPADQPAGNNASHTASRGEIQLSSDGRYVSYISSATNLTEIPEGGSALGQVIVWDRETNARIRNAVADDGSQGRHPNTGAVAPSWPAEFADGGRLAGFASLARDLVPNWVGAVASAEPLSYNPVHHQYIRDLSTAPDVSTGAATAITPSSATVAGELDVPGPDFGFQETSYTVEYGTTTAYGASVPGDDGVAGGTAGQAVAFDLGGLQPDTTYHYRVVATNGGGTVQGEDRTFTTAAVHVTPPVDVPPPGGGGDVILPPSGGGVTPPAGGEQPVAPTRFTLTATATNASLRLAAVRKSGLRLTLGVDGAATVRATATVTPATARKLGLRVRKGAKRVAIGTARTTTRAAGKRTVRIALSKATRTRLARAGRRTAVRVELRATGAGRTATTLVRTLTVRR